MSNPLQNNLDEIKRQKDTYITPKNIIENLPVFNVYGMVKPVENITTSDLIWYANINDADSDILNQAVGQRAVLYNDINNDYTGVFEIVYNEYMSMDQWSPVEIGLTAIAEYTIGGRTLLRKGVYTNYWDIKL